MAKDMSDARLLIDSLRDMEEEDDYSDDKSATESSGHNVVQALQSTTSEGWLLTKEETSSFKEAIRNYSEQCVSSAAKIRNAAIAAEKYAINAVKVRTYMDVLTEKMRQEMEKKLDACKRYSDTARRNSVDAMRAWEDINKKYDKVLFAATNAEELCFTSLHVLSTATEMLSVMDGIVYRVKDQLAEKKFSSKLDADLKNVHRDINELRSACKVKSTVATKFAELACLSRKVTEMDIYIQDRVPGNQTDDDDFEDRELCGKRTDADSSLSFRDKKKYRSAKQSVKDVSGADGNVEEKLLVEGNA